MLDRNVERLYGLTGQGAAALVDDGDRNHDGKTDLLLGKDIVDRAERGLGIERVEDRFDEQKVDASVDQSSHLLRVGLSRFVERERPEPRVIDVRAEAQGLVERPDRAGHEAGLVRATRGRLFGETCGRDVEIVDDVLQVVVGLRERVRVERVGFDDVGAGVQVLLVDPADHVGPRENQQIVVPLQALRMVAKPVAPEVRFFESCALDHRTHRTVEKDDSFLDKLLQSLCDCVFAHAVQTPLRGTAVLTSKGRLRS